MEEISTIKRSFRIFWNEKILNYQTWENHPRNLAQFIFRASVDTTAGVHKEPGNGENEEQIFMKGPTESPLLSGGENAQESDSQRVGVRWSLRGIELQTSCSRWGQLQWHYFCLEWYHILLKSVGYSGSSRSGSFGRSQRCHRSWPNLYLRNGISMSMRIKQDSQFLL